MNQDLESVFSYLKTHFTSISKEEFKYQIETHPDYPSLLAFSDALTFFNVPNIAFNLSLEEIESLPDSFIALLKKKDKQPNLYYISQKENSFYYIENDKQKKINKEELKSLWQNVVLIADTPGIQLVGERKSKLHLSVILCFSALIVLWSVYLFSHSLPFALFGLFPVIGMYLSLEALKTELGIESKVSQTFCNAIPNADCGRVINSIKNKWLQKIKISDISIWFFSSQLLALFIFSVSEFAANFCSMMFYGLLLAIPITLYSVYFQYKIENKWCPICLLIVGTIYLELIFLFILNPDFNFNLQALFLFVAVFSLVAGLVYMLKPVYVERKNLREKHIKELRFARNYEIFKNTLQKSETLTFEKEFIVLGNRNSNKKISIITSPFCGYCKDAHQILEQIMARHSNDLAISIRFNFDEDSDEITKNLFLRLGEIFITKGDKEFMKSLQIWFEDKNLENWFLKFGHPENPNDIQNKLIEVAKENAKFGLNFTPNLFLNEYNYPKPYDRDALPHFIADWLEDIEL